MNEAGTSPTSLGVDVGAGVLAPGTQMFSAGPIAGPVNMGSGWNVLVLTAGFILSGSDTVNLQGVVNMDTGSGTPACSVPDLPVFIDGFESGDTSAWSATVP